ncbi:hypothetical protein BKA70DRAFT_1225385 [Coprinopsis sp. MPI-PUGE-AT-0042]|nr:hypothetical protein BKA70DRAFT_1225385 [Coprinopsis sp. MPI-PUGE-AT-0042]
MRAALCGLAGESRIQIDALPYRVNRDMAEPYELEVTRDIDSCLVISHEICIRGQALTFYVVPMFQHSLRKDVNLTCQIQTRDGSQTAKMHQVPNFHFAHSGVRSEIIICFPGLYDPNHPSHYISDDKLHLFYEHAMRPALLDALGPRAANIPPSFSQEQFRTRSSSGRLMISGRQFPEDRIVHLGSDLRRHAAAAGLDWAENLFFFHQIRGVKDTVPHAPYLAQQALDAFIEQAHLSRELLQNQRTLWYLDIGLEISSRSGECLAWRTDAHANILMQAFGLDEENSKRLTSLGSRRYSRDTTTDLTQLSGFRIAHGQRGAGPFGILKNQITRTDQALTSTDSHPRIEVRTPSIHSASLLKPSVLPKPDLRSSRLGIPADVWWHVRERFLAPGPEQDL